MEEGWPSKPSQIHFKVQIQGGAVKFEGKAELFIVLFFICSIMIGKSSKK